NQKTIAVLAYDPLWRFAAAAPRIAAFRILVLRRQRRLLRRTPAPRALGIAEVMRSEPEFGDLLFDFRDHIRHFGATRLVGLSLQFCDLCLQFRVLGHRGLP